MVGGGSPPRGKNGMESVFVPESFDTSVILYESALPIHK